MGNIEQSGHLPKIAVPEAMRAQILTAAILAFGPSIKTQREVRLPPGQESKAAGAPFSPDTTKKQRRNA